MTKGEQDFINEYTRQLLVGWAHQTLTSPENPLYLTDPTVSGSPTSIYATHALNKGWITKDGNRVTATGFGVAAAYLRR